MISLTLPGLCEATTSFWLRKDRLGKPQIFSRQRDVAEPDHGVQVLRVAVQDLSEFSFRLHDLTIPEQVLALQEKRAIRFRPAGGRGPVLGQGRMAHRGDQETGEQGEGDQ